VETFLQGGFPLFVTGKKKEINPTDALVGAMSRVTEKLLQGKLELQEKEEKEVQI